MLSCLELQGEKASFSRESEGKEGAVAVLSCSAFPVGHAYDAVSRRTSMGAHILQRVSARVGVWTACRGHVAGPLSSLCRAPNPGLFLKDLEQ